MFIILIWTSFLHDLCCSCCFLFYLFDCVFLMHPNLLDRLNCKSKGENNRRIMSCSMLLSSQHFEGRRSCQSSKMGTKTSDKWVNYSHRPTQTKQKVGQCVVATLLVHGQTTGKHKLTRFTTAQTWGNPPPSSMPSHEACTQMPFCPGTPKLGIWES